MGCSSTSSARWLAEVSWWGKRHRWGDAGGAPGTRHPCCGSHRPAGHRPEMQAMVLSHLAYKHSNSFGSSFGLHELNADCSGMHKTGNTVGASSPRFLGGWVRGAACPGCALAGGAAALPLTRDGGAAFTPSAGMVNPFRLALLPENREGLNYEDLEHASFHGVAKDICLSTL